MRYLIYVAVKFSSLSIFFFLIFICCYFFLISNFLVDGDTLNWNVKFYLFYSGIFLL